MAIPIEGLNQCMGRRQFRFVLCYRLGIPLFVENSPCPCFGSLMDAFGDHAVHCTNDVGLKFRHNLVRDGLADIFFKSGVVVRKEVSLGIQSGNDPNPRQADIMVYN